MLTREALALAKKIKYYPYVKDKHGQTIKWDDRSLWENWLNFDCHDQNFFSAIFQKALADNFPLEEYYFYEMPVSSIVLFSNKEDCDNVSLHKKNIPIREISFEWNANCKPSVTPVKTVHNQSIGCLETVAVRTCKEAVVVLP